MQAFFAPKTEFFFFFSGPAPPRFRFGFPVISLFAFPRRVLGCGAKVVFASFT